MWGILAERDHCCTLCGRCAQFVATQGKRNRSHPRSSPTTDGLAKLEDGGRRSWGTGAAVLVDGTGGDEDAAVGTPGSRVESGRDAAWVVESEHDGGGGVRWCGWVASGGDGGGGERGRAAIGTWFTCGLERVRRGIWCGERGEK
jgi:hypothetical protein